MVSLRSGGKSIMKRDVLKKRSMSTSTAFLKRELGLPITIRPAQGLVTKGTSSTTGVNCASLALLAKTPEKSATAKKIAVTHPIKAFGCDPVSTSVDVFTEA